MDPLFNPLGGDRTALYSSDSKALKSSVKDQKSSICETDFVVQKRETPYNPAFSTETIVPSNFVYNLLQLVGNLFKYFKNCQITVIEDTSSEPGKIRIQISQLYSIMPQIPEDCFQILLSDLCKSLRACLIVSHPESDLSIEEFKNYYFSRIGTGEFHCNPVSYEFKVQLNGDSAVSVHFFLGTQYIPPQLKPNEIVHNFLSGDSAFSILEGDPFLSFVQEVDLYKDRQFDVTFLAEDLTKEKISQRFLQDFLQRLETSINPGEKNRMIMLALKHWSHLTPLLEKADRERLTKILKNLASSSTLSIFESLHGTKVPFLLFVRELNWPQDRIPSLDSLEGNVSIENFAALFIPFLLKYLDSKNIIVVLKHRETINPFLNRDDLEKLNQAIANVNTLTVLEDLHGNETPFLKFVRELNRPQESIPSLSSLEGNYTLENFVRLFMPIFLQHLDSRSLAFVLKHWANVTPFLAADDIERLNLALKSASALSVLEELHGKKTPFLSFVRELNWPPEHTPTLSSLDGNLTVVNFALQFIPLFLERLEKPGEKNSYFMTLLKHWENVIPLFIEDHIKKLKQLIKKQNPFKNNWSADLLYAAQSRDLSYLESLLQYFEKVLTDEKNRAVSINSVLQPFLAQKFIHFCSRYLSENENPSTDLIQTLMTETMRRGVCDETELQPVRQLRQGKAIDRYLKMKNGKAVSENERAEMGNFINELSIELEDDQKPDSMTTLNNTLHFLMLLGGEYENKTLIVLLNSLAKRADLQQVVRTRLQTKFIEAFLDDALALVEEGKGSPIDFDTSRLLQKWSDQKKKNEIQFQRLFSLLQSQSDFAGIIKFFESIYESPLVEIAFEQLLDFYLITGNESLKRLFLQGFSSLKLDLVSLSRILVKCANRERFSQMEVAPILSAWNVKATQKNGKHKPDEIEVIVRAITYVLVTGLERMAEEELLNQLIHDASCLGRERENEILCDLLQTFAENRDLQTVVVDTIKRKLTNSPLNEAIELAKIVAKFPGYLTDNLCTEFIQKWLDSGSKEEEFFQLFALFRSIRAFGPIAKLCRAVKNPALVEKTTEHLLRMYLEEGRESLNCLDIVALSRLVQKIEKGDPLTNSQKIDIYSAWLSKLTPEGIDAIKWNKLEILKRLILLTQTDLFTGDSTQDRVDAMLNQVILTLNSLYPVANLPDLILTPNEVVSLLTIVTQVENLAKYYYLNDKYSAFLSFFRDLLNSFSTKNSAKLAKKILDIIPYLLAWSARWSDKTFLKALFLSACRLIKMTPAEARDQLLQDTVNKSNEVVRSPTYRPEDALAHERFAVHLCFSINEEIRTEYPKTTHFLLDLFQHEVRELLRLLDLPIETTSLTPTRIAFFSSAYHMRLEIVARKIRSLRQEKNGKDFVGKYLKIFSDIFKIIKKMPDCDDRMVISSFNSVLMDVCILTPIIDLSEQEEVTEILNENMQAMKRLRDSGSMTPEELMATILSLVLDLDYLKASVGKSWLNALMTHPATIELLLTPGFFNARFVSIALTADIDAIIPPRIILEWTQRIFDCYINNDTSCNKLQALSIPEKWLKFHDHLDQELLKEVFKLSDIERLTAFFKALDPSLMIILPQKMIGTLIKILYSKMKEEPTEEKRAMITLLYKLLYRWMLAFEGLGPIKYELWNVLFLEVFQLFNSMEVYFSDQKHSEEFSKMSVSLRQLIYTNPTYHQQICEQLRENFELNLLEEKDSVGKSENDAKSVDVLSTLGILYAHGINFLVALSLAVKKTKDVKKQNESIELLQEHLKIIAVLSKKLATVCPELIEQLIEPIFAGINPFAKFLPPKNDAVIEIPIGLGEPEVRLQLGDLERIEFPEIAEFQTYLNAKRDEIRGVIAEHKGTSSYYLEINLEQLVRIEVQV